MLQDLIRRTRNEAGLTRGELVHALQGANCSVSEVTLHYWESGKRRPSNSNLNALARVLCWTPSQKIAALRSIGMPEFAAVARVA